MNTLFKASFGLFAFAALSQTGAAHAKGMITVMPTAINVIDAKATVTAPAAGTNDPYQYSYAVTPDQKNSSPEGSLDFQFSDPSVVYVSSTGPLDMVTPSEPGSFHAAGSELTFYEFQTVYPKTYDDFDMYDGFRMFDGPITFQPYTQETALNPGSTETFVFSSFNGPQGTLSVSGNTGDMSGQVLGPAAVPEASTTVSFGLLLALGVGGAAVASRKKTQAV